MCINAVFYTNLFIHCFFYVPMWFLDYLVITRGIIVKKASYILFFQKKMTPLINSVQPLILKLQPLIN